MLTSITEASKIYINIHLWAFSYIYINDWFKDLFDFPW